MTSRIQTYSRCASIGAPRADAAGRALLGRRRAARLHPDRSLARPAVLRALKGTRSWRPLKPPARQWRGSGRSASAALRSASPPESFPCRSLDRSEAPCRYIPGGLGRHRAGRAGCRPARRRAPCPAGGHRVAEGDGDDRVGQRQRGGPGADGRLRREPAEGARRADRAHQGERGPGTLVKGTLTGTGTKRLMLIAHMDTVYPDGTLATQP